MFTVMAVNRTGDVEGLSSYDVQVKVNAQVIWQGSVVHYRTPNNWPDLLKRIAETALASRAEPLTF